MQLKDFALFSGLSQEDAIALETSTNIRRHPAGTVIFEQGQPAIGFYLVLAGAVKIYKLSPKGQEQILTMVGPGGSFAEAAVFLGKGYPASAECLQESQLIFVERAVLLRLLQHDSELALRMMAGMALKLRQLVSLVEDLTLRDARGRLCRYLLTLSNSHNGDPSTEINLPTSQVVLAHLLGLTSETLSRTLRVLKDEGVIDTSRGGRIEVHSLEELRLAAGEAELD